MEPHLWMRESIEVKETERHGNRFSERGKGYDERIEEEKSDREMSV